MLLPSSLLSLELPLQAPPDNSLKADPIDISMFDIREDMYDLHLSAHVNLASFTVPSILIGLHINKKGDS